MDDDCVTCTEIVPGLELPIDKCRFSERGCGHHCNHVWTHDTCCWCHYEYEEEA